MIRQKIRLLRQLTESGVLSHLPERALKAYLVLLASAEQIGRDQIMERETLERALGGYLDRRQLQSIGAMLKRWGLAVLTPDVRPGGAASRGEALRYRLLGPKGSAR